MTLSHLDQAGRPHMVDVTGKPATARTAVAEGAIQMSREAFQLVADGAVAKGNVNPQLLAAVLVEDLWSGA